MTARYHDYWGYVFTIAYQAQDPAYTVDFPDFPEIITSAGTLAEARSTAHAKLSTCISKACKS